jgi:hypothetical protein
MDLVHRLVAGHLLDDHAEQREIRVRVAELLAWRTDRRVSFDIG